MFAPIFVQLCISGFCMGSAQAQVMVNALAAPDARSQTKFLVVPAVAGVQPSDLQFQEYANDVGRALVAQGFEKAESPADVTMVVMLNWVISEPQRHVVSGTTTTMQQQRVVDGVSAPMAPGLPASVNSHTEFAPVQTPTTQTVTTYVRAIGLKVYDQTAYNATKQAKELWEATIVSEGSGSDMRAAFPVMIAAAQPYLGVNTTKPALVALAVEDAKVKFIRGEAAAPSRK